MLKRVWFTYFANTLSRATATIAGVFAQAEAKISLESRKPYREANRAATAAKTTQSSQRATLHTTKIRQKLMGPWYLFGALLMLSASMGDSTQQIIIPQQIGGGTGSNGHITNIANVGGMHHHKGTVLSGNGVIMAGGTALGTIGGPSSMLNSE